jgi:hypothetical protein
MAARAFSGRDRLMRSPDRGEGQGSIATASMAADGGDEPLTIH